MLSIDINKTFSCEWSNWCLSTVYTNYQNHYFFIILFSNEIWTECNHCQATLSSLSYLLISIAIIPRLVFKLRAIQPQHLQLLVVCNAEIHISENPFAVSRIQTHNVAMVSPKLLPPPHVTKYVAILYLSCHNQHNLICSLNPIIPQVMKFVIWFLE